MLILYKCFVYNNKMSDNQGKESTFNEASLKMQRIHSLQDLVNKCSVNLLGKNVDSSIFNYEVIVSILSQLFKEGYSKLTTDEKDEGYSKLSKLKLFILKNDLIKNVNNEYGKTTGTKINRENYVELEKLIFHFEVFVKDCLDKHGYGSPNKRDKGKAVTM